MKMRKYCIIIPVIFFSFYSITNSKPKLCITFNDPNSGPTPSMDWQTRNESLLKCLSKHGLQAALFVCGKRVDDSTGKRLLEAWDKSGHMICNHSYSHKYYNSPKAVAAEFFGDILKGDSIIRNYRGYTKLFRFPYLKEGAAKENRDFIRENLKKIGYRNGYVSIDASDWFIDGKIIEALQADSSTGLEPYKDYYLAHLLERANYYNGLAIELTGREISHTLLLHHSLLNALYLDDVINMFEKNGWDVIDASEAYKDSVYTLEPDIVPAGESIIWALAKESGKYNATLRYPAEDGTYEEKKLIRFLKNYKK